MSKPSSSGLREIILKELRFFDSSEQRNAFLSLAIEPEAVEQQWSYGEEPHLCFVVARGEEEQIVYCSSGFGPAFPWSAQPLGTTDLGIDGQWNAYLYECFVASSMWPHPVPPGFKLHGPGERSET